MEKVRIQLCLLGHQEYIGLINKIKKYRNKLFMVSGVKKIDYLPETDFWGCCSDDAVVKLLKNSHLNNDNADLCICFIDKEIEGNYFTRELRDFDEKTVLCSFYQVEDMFRAKNVDMFNYVLGVILNNVIQIKTLHHLDEKTVNHFDTRGCIFDFCGEKEDIVIKYGNPALCTDCSSMIKKSVTDEAFLDELYVEFKKMRRNIFLSILDFMRRHTILAIIIGAVATIVLNLVSNFTYDLIKYLWGF